MNKSLAGILGVTVALTLLAGCTAYDRTKDQFTQPVVKDVKKGMARQQGMQISLTEDIGLAGAAGMDHGDFR